MITKEQLRLNYLKQKKIDAEKEAKKDGVYVYIGLDERGDKQFRFIKLEDVKYQGQPLSKYLEEAKKKTEEQIKRLEEAINELAKMIDENRFL